MSKIDPADRYIKKLFQQFLFFLLETRTEFSKGINNTELLNFPDLTPETISSHKHLYGTKVAFRQNCQDKCQINGNIDLKRVNDVSIHSFIK